MNGKLWVIAVMIAGLLGSVALSIYGAYADRPEMVFIGLIAGSFMTWGIFDVAVHE
jgi:hypothetical protein